MPAPGLEPTASQVADPLRTEASGLRTSGTARSSGTHSSLDDARFPPGTMLAGRYRIVGLLGKGGMGEVYRAHDLKLGREVALKFLPEAFERDDRRLQRFLGEARLSLQVTHANVCRVHDIGDLDGRHFISMEYIDGDDLASLLRRVGRFPEDKAIEVARQLCAGLAAAHDQGVLHRDLKPSNVLVDGRGQVKITDFGLAAPLAEGGETARAGTPAYMAPEQWSRSEVSIQSDLYALGLVLYELFTGRPAFHGKTPAEFAELHRESEPTSPATLVDGLDPAVERVILRCLEKEPEDRPRSARSVVAALPGGDPLAAALAAGETPSPELVAHSTAKGGLAPRVAVILCAVLLASIAGLVRLGGDVQLARLVPNLKPPAVLAERARELLRQFAPGVPPVDEVYLFEPNKAYLHHLSEAPPQPDGWSQLRRTQPSGLLFEYRSHAELFSRVNGGALGDWMTDPPPDRPGMTRVTLDPQGRLLGLWVMPPVWLDSTRAADPPDWGRLLGAAGFDPAALRPATPEWRPPSYADALVAWDGTYPDSPATAVHIEAAALRGRPVAFNVFEPWNRAQSAEKPAVSRWERFAQRANMLLFLLALAGAAVVAHRNVRLGRGDRRGATRFALYFGAVRMVWFLGAHHVPGAGETEILVSHLAWAMYRVGVVWIFYLAFEPYARRMWPHMMVSWVRVLGGRFRDPLVGRDVLVSIAAGAVIALLLRLAVWLPAELGAAPPLFDVEIWNYEALRGVRYVIVGLAAIHNTQTLYMLVGIMAFLVIRLLSRSTVAGVVTVSLFVLLQVLTAPGSRAANLAVNLVVQAAFWLAFFRLGFLVVILAPSIAAILASMPLTLQFDAWFASSSYLTLAFVLGLAALAVRAAVAGRSAGSTAAPARPA